MENETDLKKESENLDKAPKKESPSKKKTPIEKYAVFQTGGKQYLVNEGMVIDIEKIETSEKETVTFNDILLLQDGSTLNVGEPYVKDSKVTATVLNQYKDKKKIVFKFKKKTGNKKKQGHRQNLTTIKIKSIH